MLDLLRQDLRYALRQLRRSPGFTAVALLTLALGIGATTAIFSVVRGVLLRPLPYAHPDRVVMVWNRWTGYERTWISPAELFDYRKAKSLADVAAFSPTAANLEGEQGAERVASSVVTPGLFDVLGVSAERGRTFREEEGRVGGPTDVVLLTDGLWRRRYGADPSVLGRRILVDGAPRTVVGILPPGVRLPLQFGSPRPAELFVPLPLDPAHLTRGSHFLYGVGRLAPGATSATVTTELETIIGRVQAATGEYPPEMHFEPFTVPVLDQVVGSVRTALWILLGAVGLVLLIACVNIANLLLARLEARRREFAVRSALGAGRAALARQLLVEGGLLAAGGAALGVGVALAALRVLGALGSGSVPRLGDVRLDLPVLAATALVAVGCAVAFALAPLLHLGRNNLTERLREGGRGASGGPRLRFRRALVGIQAMLALVLLVGAGLLVRSFWGLAAVDPGVRAGGVLSYRISLPSAEFPENGDVTGFYDRLLDRLRRIPGVRDAGAVRALPLRGSIGDWNFDIEGRTPNQRSFTADWQVATPGYFRSAGIPLVSGRTFRASDDVRAPGVILIDRSLAERYWPGESPLGQRIRIHAGTDHDPWLTVIGVVGNVRYATLTEPPRPTWYVPEAQAGAALGSPRRTLSVLVRTAGDPQALLSPVRAVMHDLDPRVPLARVATLDDVVSTARAEPRFLMTLLVSFALLATVLAATGLYGVMAYFVRQRDREVAVRIAMGAHSRQVIGLVLRQGLLPVAAGLVAGLVVAVAASRALGSLLYGIGALDPLTYAVVAVGFGLVAALACALPARRATRLEPAAVLREE
jgi:putative ABC transport system permease protein